MIPYSELVAALTTWRVRQNLPTGHTDYLGEPMPMAPTALPETAAEVEAVEYTGEVLAEDLIEEVSADDFAEIPDEPVESGELYSDDATEMVDMATEQQPALSSSDYAAGGYAEPYQEPVGEGGYPAEQPGYTTADEAYQAEEGYQPEEGYQAEGYQPEPSYQPEEGYQPEPSYPPEEGHQPEPASYDAAALDGPPDPFAEAAPLDEPAPAVAIDSEDSTLDVDDELIMAEDDMVPAAPPPLEPPPGDDEPDPEKGW